MKHFLLGALFAVPAALAGEAHTLTSAEWDRPRDGLSILQKDAVRQSVLQLLAAPNGRLLIRYPGGDEGALWATELKAWLVGLGVGSERMELLPGGVEPGQVLLEVLSEQ